MSRRYYNGTLIPASTFGYSAALDPSFYRSAPYLTRDLADLYDLRDPRRSRDGDRDETTPRETLESLKNPKLDHNGDLGWTVEYATAYCYKHLNANRPGVVAAIDSVRIAPVHKTTPFVIFDMLDRAIFTNKLKNMVYLKWKTLELHSPGVTSAANKKVKRISIELNSMPFEDPDAEIDELLDALIHQMIHAYFLVCCGKQKEGAAEDGRLSDGIHFGVILSTIRDISRDCRRGKLDLIFYAVHRHGNPASRFTAFGDPMGMRRDIDSFIAIDPKGSNIGPPPSDGQSHCTHDNQRLRYPQIRNWQVEEYARCIDLELETKGDKVYDLSADNELKDYDRLHGPPSADYIELIWDKKRVMVPRAKVLAIPSLKKVAVKLDRFELKLPDCDIQVLRCLYDFLLHKRYAEDDGYRHHRHHPCGPPVIVASRDRDKSAKNGITTHIRVFKLAENLKFAELQTYALERLYNMATTDDDPITALKELYNAADDEYKGKPIAADLHKWARDFFKRCDDSGHYDDAARGLYGTRTPYYCPPPSPGTSNYMKLLKVFGDKFEQLYHANAALKEDVKNVVNALSVGDLTSTASAMPLPVPLGTYPHGLDPRDHHRRRFSSTSSLAGDPIWDPAPGLLPPSRSRLLPHPDDVYDPLRGVYDPRRRDERVRDRVTLTSERLRDLYALDDY